MTASLDAVPEEPADSGLFASRLPLPVPPHAGQLAFGAWGIGGEWGAPTDGAVARRTIERALELNVTLFDTAPTYGGGRSETLLGDVLHARRDEVVLATKCGPYDDPHASLLASLTRLRTEYVDLFQLHELPTANPATPRSLERHLDAMRALLDAGLTRAIGLCNASVRELERARHVAPIATYQGAYNLIDRDAEHALLPATRALGAGFLAYRPLASGLLTGKFASPPTFALDDHRARIYWFRGNEFTRRRALIDRLAPIARDCAFTLTQLALAWVLHRPGVTAVLVGARTPAQMDENAGATRPLDPAIVARIDGAVAATYPPRALRRGVRVAPAPDERGDYPVAVALDPPATPTPPLVVGAREAYVMTRLDGRTPYDRIAADWRGDDRALLTAQVVLLVDQLADLGLLEDA